MSEAENKVADAVGRRRGARGGNLGGGQYGSGENNQ
jgi:hypothetical protein